MDLPSILIPAYKPDSQMISLIRELIDTGFTRLLVVNDGSGPEYDACFNEAEALGCKVLRHAINMGKGRALKTGLNEAMLSGYADRGIITADADGQHAPRDIYRVALAMQESPEALVLGVRRFTGKVPIRNKMGNAITRGVFALVNGNGIMDTQTGLRGIPLRHLPLMLSLKGERYEYEMNMLLEARPNDVHMVQVPIDTIYIEGNKSSHYHPFIDSVRIYALILRYILSSIVAGIVDYGVFAVMHLSFPRLLIESVVVARILSSIVNFMINRKIVFRQKGTVAHAAFRYYSLVVFIMLCSYGLIWTLSGPLGLNVFLAKIITDAILSIVSFFAQREFVYSSAARIKIFKNHQTAVTDLGSE
ncbi:MAG: bifunctional glycosyltransferase family 2/GtrA family protein [Bacillota bacterium]|nr:bifunctional glycosyltransferase family 2/GtrA family protein [Bacillota bacterium]